MKRSYFLCFLFLVAVVTFIGFKCSDSPVSQSKFSSAEYAIFFEKEINEEQLFSLIAEYNIEGITELRYKIGEITFGYSLNSAGIEAEIKNGLRVHVKNTNIILLELRNDNEKFVSQEILALNLQLEQSMKFAENMDFSFSGINLITSNEVIKKLFDNKIISGYFLKGEKNKEQTEVEKVRREPWAPYEGTSEVTQYYATNKFRFNNVAAFSAINSYEHETQFYDGSVLYSFANYNGSWSSNMPYAYLDSRFLDDPRIENYAVGSNKPNSFVNNRWYYTHIALKPGALPYCNVRIKGQLGKKRYNDCYSGAWCTLQSLATTGTLLLKNAPWSPAQSWTYNK